jgi:hypothetical protein
MDLNGDLQRSGNALTEVMRQQVESRTTLDNIDEAIETLKVTYLSCHAYGNRNV